MIEKHSTLEVVLGILLFVMAVGFGWNLWRDKGQVLTKNTYSLKASFDNVAGIDVGSAVKISGIKVGRVVAKDINKTTYRSDIMIDIANDIAVPNDSRLVIGSAGLLGAPEIKIELGGSKDMLAADDSFATTISQPSLEEMIGRTIFVLNAVGGGEQKSNTDDDATPTP